MIYLNKFDSPKGIMLAMCDEELIGRVLKEGKVEIDLEKYGAFYKGDLMSEEEASDLVTDKVYSANVVGDRCVSIFVKKGLVKPEDIKTVQGVKFIHLFRIL
ncbi:MAG: DUF424 domain-containing protein [Candidatus Micrarchaeaceae archaeon]